MKGNSNFIFISTCIVSICAIVAICLFPEFVFSRLNDGNTINYERQFEILFVVIIITLTFFPFFNIMKTPKKEECKCEERILQYKAISFDLYKCKKCDKEFMIEKDWINKINCEEEDDN